MAYEVDIAKAKEQFGKIIEQQIARVEKVKADKTTTDFTKVRPIVVGVLGGDGIGPIIAIEARRVLENVLKDDLASGKVKLRIIEGLTIENRAKQLKPLPPEVLAEIKECHVTLKGPTTTPEKGDGWPNIESANVAMRKELDLFANVRPVRIPKEGVDWTFFRENTEDLYAVGSQGVQPTPDIGFDFRVISVPGSERILRAGFDHAKKTGKKQVSIVTKANIVKTTDGIFLDAAKRVAAEYPGIQWDAWYVDIMSAKLIDQKRRRDFQVIILPNLYGDILTDEAAELQGGVGTAGSANIGSHHGMFEAIHGSAPRMVKEGRAKYADPASMIRAGSMLLEHIGYTEAANKINMAIDICGQYEKKVTMTGRNTGATGTEFTDYLLSTMKDSKLQARWEAYVKA